MTQAVAAIVKPRRCGAVLSLLRHSRSPASEERKAQQRMIHAHAERTFADGDGQGSVVAAVSDAMVHLYKEQFGRGPSHVRTYWCADDILVTTLEHTLTPAERNLAALGEHQRLRDTRIFFQYATVREFCETVEQLTGRTVKSFISGIDTEVDGLSVETFILHPQGSDAPSRTEQTEA
jgi:uncharacterized protein YbcI